MTISRELTIIVVTMYVDSSTIQKDTKSYTRHLLRESFRENGKVKHRTLLNLSHCSQEEIEALKLALRHKGKLQNLGTVEDVKTVQGTRIGAVYTLFAIAERLGIVKALGYDQNGKRALWQVLARIIDQGSRLSAVRLAESHAALDLLGLQTFCEDDLYRNLAWLADNQMKIEQRLYRMRYPKGDAPELFLYDVTSSYLEGVKNEFANWGYNRDGKKGKMQIVIGLLVAPHGDPVAVRVFEGNTKDTATVSEQIRILAEQFGVKHVTVVGDKGMLKGPQIGQLTAAGFNYITSLSKPEIRTLLAQKTLQMDLFDETITEVTDEIKGIRYVLRRNPVRCSEISESRSDRRVKITQFATKQTEYLKGSERRDSAVALRKVKEKIGRYKLKEILEATMVSRTIRIRLDENALAEAALLDGCYVVKTDLPKESLDARNIHDRYKDLSEVETAFRTFKKGHLEVQPIFVRKEKSTQGHVFVVMLTYLIERELKRLWSQAECSIAEGVDELGSIRGTIIEIQGVACQKVPETKDLAAQLLRLANIKLPKVLPISQVHVATRKKLINQR